MRMRNTEDTLHRPTSRTVAASRSVQPLIEAGVVPDVGFLQLAGLGQHERGRPGRERLGRLASRAKRSFVVSACDGW
jgi:hypothetical protein